MLRQILRKLGEEEQVNVCREEKDIRVGEMEDNQSNLHCFVIEAHMQHSGLRSVKVMTHQSNKMS